MSYFKTKVQQPKSAADYLRTNFEVMAKDIHHLDQIELHKQTGEIIYSTLTSKALMAQRLQNSLDNTIAQLHLENASSQAKDNRIKTLEEIIIGLGHDPKDVKATEALIKNKDEDIIALRKQLKLPPSTHPQTAEIIKKKSEEELMDLLLKLNERLNETEQELEKALKDKQGESTSQPPNLIPIVSTAVPSTLGAALAPNILAVIVEVVATTTGTTGVAQGSIANLSTEELIKSMEDIKIQVSELNKVKEQYSNLDQRYDLSEINAAEKIREIKVFENKVQ